ncbi:MAG: hypothetical protein AAGD25_17745 [Cyanobacteria bacterium P01_F01_bin.150]
MSLPQLRQPSHPLSDSSHLDAPAPNSYNRKMLATRRNHNRTRADREMAIEVGAMMGVNLFVAVIAVVTIVKLIPHNATQQEQLQSLEAEVTALDNRVDILRQEFAQYFDPQQALVNKRQLSDRLSAGQRKIILMEPSTVEESANLDSEALDSQNAVAD